MSSLIEGEERFLSGAGKPVKLKAGMRNAGREAGGNRSMDRRSSPPFIRLKVLPHLTVRPGEAHDDEPRRH
jgi:hypothetical protein